MKLCFKTKAILIPLYDSIGVVYYATSPHNILTECDDGLYGANCEGFCSPDCKTPGMCDKRTGQCDGGCQAGWTQHKCDSGMTV